MHGSLQGENARESALRPELPAHCGHAQGEFGTGTGGHAEGALPTGDKSDPGRGQTHTPVHGTATQSEMRGEMIIDKILNI